MSGAAELMAHFLHSTGGPFGVYGIRLNGNSNQYLTIGTNISGAAPRLYEGWYRGAATPQGWVTATQVPLISACQPGTANGDFTLWHNGSTTKASCYFNVNIWGAGDFQHYAELPTTRDVHIALGYVNPTVYLFVDKVLVKTKNVGTLVTPSTGLYFGKDWTNTYAAARFAGLRVRTTVPSLAQLQAQAGLLLPPTTADLWAEWPLTEGQGTFTDDYSGNNRNLTIAGGAAWGIL